MAALNFVMQLPSILFSEEGLKGKGFELVLWLFDTVKSTIKDETSAIRELNGDLERIEATVRRIKVLLDDADTRRIIKDKTIIAWLRDLYILSLNGEDLLDLVRTRTTREQHQSNPAAPTATPRSRKRKFSWRDLVPTSAYYCSSSVPLLLFQREAAKEVAAIKYELEEIQKRKQMRLQHGESDLRSTAEDPPEVADPQIQFVGMVSDRETIINSLVQGELVPSPMVVAINGMAGTGKTATAQSAYNHERVKGFFDVRIWIDVKRELDVVKIINQMLESLGEHRHYCNFDTSKNRIEELVLKKTVLVVLDNTEDVFWGRWEKFRAPLCSAAPGSKVLVTTTSNKVVSQISASVTYQVEGLSEEEWLQLFASMTGDLIGHERLQNLAREMGRRCQWSPFAAKSLGGLLLDNRDVQQWIAVLGAENQRGTATEGDREMRQMLRRSYDFLSLRLKRCFGFCAVFPDDHELDRQELVKMWLALGLVSKEGDGLRCFSDLEKKSFFQKVSVNPPETGREQKCPYYRIPGLMHGLARSVSGDECLIVSTGGDSHNHNHGAISTAARHLLLNCSCLGNEVPQLLDSSLNPAEHRRTLIVLQCLTKLPMNLSLKMPCLRILDLSCTAICKLPEWIGELKLLRYFNLCKTLIAKLPDSVTSLCNLQTLNLDGCYFLHELPEETSNLTALRHLSLRLSKPRCSNLAFMPPNLGKLTNLQTLSRFIVDERSEGCCLDQLQNLNDITGDLWISKLENVKAGEDSQKANLDKKLGIISLTLEWTTELEVVPLHSQHRDVLEGLKPPPYLKSLWIDGYYGYGPPKWMSGMTTLKSLHLSHCQNWVSLTVLEKLLQLENLLVEHLENVKIMKPSDPATDKFGNLRTLTLRNMPNLRFWNIYVGQMPKLEELCFSHCPKLEDPRGFVPASATIRIQGCLFA